MRGPTAAERARTLAYGMAGGVLAAPGLPDSPVPAHATDDSGRPLLLMSAESPVVAALWNEPDLPATLRVADVAAVPLADRVRGQAWLHGWLTEVPEHEQRQAALRLSQLHTRTEPIDLAGDGMVWALVALEIAEVEVSDGWGDAVLEPEEYAAAVPDPFVAIEPGMLTHLDAQHRAELAALFQERFGPVEPAPLVRPLGLDRHGLWLRCLGAEPLDLRVEFPAPVSDLHSLRAAYRRLFAARTT